MFKQTSKLRFGIIVSKIVLKSPYELCMYYVCASCLYASQVFQEKPRLLANLAPRAHLAGMFIVAVCGKAISQSCALRTVRAAAR